MQYGAPFLFFACFFVFLLCYINPAVIYSGNGIDIHKYVTVMHTQEVSRQNADIYEGSSFSKPFILELTPAFAKEIVCAPGGITRLAVTLCIYACHYPIAGALCVTLLALFFYWIFPLYLSGTGSKRLFIIRFIPSFFLLTICAWYELRFCVFLMPVAGALALAVCFQRFRLTGVFARVLWLSFLFWCAWYFLQWGSAIFIFFVVIHDFFSRDSRHLPIVITAAVNGALLFAVETCFLPLDMGIRWSDFTLLSGLPLVVIGFFPLSAIILATWRRFQRTSERDALVKAVIVQITLLVCCTFAVVVWLCQEPVNRDTRTIARTMHHIMTGQWDAILHEKTSALYKDFPQKAGPIQEFMIHAVDHALCRTGQLGDKLFTFPQAVLSDEPLFMLETTHTNGYVNWIAVMELAMDIGMVNTAEKIAGEIMENVGPYPDVMYRRALIQIAKGNNEAAAVYLNKLACMPFYRTEAKRLLGMFGKNSDLLSEPRIAAMRTNMDTTDYFLFTVSYDAMLKHLLQSNPGNKAAYDYMMTFYLLTGRPEGLVALLPAALAFGYTALPRYWEEALCVYQATNSQQPSSNGSVSGLRPEAVERFNLFAKSFIQIADDPAAADKLAPAFGDSYYYFSVFRHSKGAQHE